MAANHARQDCHGRFDSRRRGVRGQRPAAASERSISWPVRSISDEIDECARRGEGGSRRGERAPDAAARCDVDMNDELRLRSEPSRPSAPPMQAAHASSWNSAWSEGSGASMAERSEAIAWPMVCSTSASSPAPIESTSRSSAPRWLSSAREPSCSPAASGWRQNSRKQRER
eukprot:6013107-Prymnesium_polylepis.1